MREAKDSLKGNAFIVACKSEKAGLETLEWSAKKAKKIEMDLEYVDALYYLCSSDRPDERVIKFVVDEITASQRKEREEEEHFAGGMRRVRTVQREEKLKIMFQPNSIWNLSPR